MLAPPDTNYRSKMAKPQHAVNPQTSSSSHHQDPTYTSTSSLAF